MYFSVSMADRDTASRTRQVGQCTAHVVARQIGRPPREPWRVAFECSHGWPVVIATPSRLVDSTPFPTLYWLTCPHLVEAVGDLESAGGVVAWEARMAADPEMGDALARAHEAYASDRATESGGEDACAGTGIAGTADPARLKCLHAHVAAYLAGVADPVGEALLAEVAPECGTDRCHELTADAEGVCP